MQGVKLFFQGTKAGKTRLEFVENQINDFLADNPRYVAKSISMVQTALSLDAYVLFDVSEEQSDKKPQITNQPKNKPRTDPTSINSGDYNNKSQKVTATNGQ